MKWYSRVCGVTACVTLAATGLAYTHWWAARTPQLLLPEPEQRAQQMAKTNICTMVQNEEDTISEWLAYHHGIIGVPRFYLYSDRTTDATRDAVDMYVRRGVVTWIEWNETSAQPIWDQITGADGGFDGIGWDGGRSHQPTKLSDFFANPKMNPFYKQYLANRDCWE